MTMRTNQIRLWGNGWKGEVVEMDQPLGFTATRAKEQALAVYRADRAEFVSLGNAHNQRTEVAPTSSYAEISQPMVRGPEAPQTTVSRPVVVERGGGEPLGVLGLLGLAAVLVIGGGATLIDNVFPGVIATPEATQVEQVAPPVERVAPVVRAYEEPVAPVGEPQPVPFFATEGLQEEAMDDLGQNWDN